MAPSSFSKTIKKKPLVRSVTETKVAGRWSFRHSWSALRSLFLPVFAL
jgi:hypothetical protein